MLREPPQGVSQLLHNTLGKQTSNKDYLDDQNPGNVSPSIGILCYVFLVKKEKCETILFQTFLLCFSEWTENQRRLDAVCCCRSITAKPADKSCRRKEHSQTLKGIDEL